MLAACERGAPAPPAAAAMSAANLARKKTAAGPVKTLKIKPLRGESAARARERAPPRPLGRTPHLGPRAAPTPARCALLRTLTPPAPARCPFSCPSRPAAKPKLPENFEEQTWARLEQAINAVHAKTPGLCL